MVVPPVGQPGRIYADGSSRPTPLSIALAAKDITRDDLAHGVGCSPAWIGELAKGRRQPSARLAVRIAEVLDVADPADLFGCHTEAVVIAFVKRTTEASGVPERVTDAVTAERVAMLLQSGTP